MGRHHQDWSVFGRDLFSLHPDNKADTHEHEAEDDADHVPEHQPPASEGGPVHLLLGLPGQPQHGEAAGTHDADEGDEEAEGEEDNSQQAHLGNLNITVRASHR